MTTAIAAINTASKADMGEHNNVQLVQGTRGALHVGDAVLLSGNVRVDLSISGTAAQTAVLPAGLYDVWAGTDCFVLVETVATTVTTSNGYLLRANNTITVQVPHNYKIGAITSAAAGTLSAFRVR